MPFMPTKKSKIQTRILIAASLLVASILSSVLISALSNQKESFWIADRELSPGQQIAASDISKVQVNISAISNNYISTDFNPIGTIVINRIQRSSLIATQSISSQSDSINSAELSLTIRAIDLPAAVLAGDRISIYLLEDAETGAFPSEPELVLSDIYLGSIERKNSNFGSEAAITIAIGRDEISDVLRATTYGRLVVVKLNG
jgi:Flp pilus assembly protein CpaB